MNFRLIYTCYNLLLLTNYFFTDVTRNIHIIFKGLVRVASGGVLVLVCRGTLRGSYEV